MKTTRKSISISKNKISQNRDWVIRYYSFRTTVKPRTDNSPPEYCLELHDDGSVTKLYAGNEASFNRFAKLVAGNKGHIRFVIGEKLLGFRRFCYPTGWPSETADASRAMSAASQIVQTAEGYLPPKMSPQYPLLRKPGIEVMDFRNGPLVTFLAYSSTDKIDVSKNWVTFMSGNRQQGIASIRIALGFTDVAKKLAKALTKKTPRRLIVNEFVHGIRVTMTDGSRLELGNPYYKDECKSD
jgi:hypothetical protein